MDLSNLYDIADNENINIKFLNLRGIKGVSVEVDERYHIGLAKRILSSNRELRDVLSEELGHCCTNSLYLINVTNGDLRRLNVGRYENIAKVWAIKHLVDSTKLASVLCSNCNNLWATAEELDLSYEQLDFAIEYYQSVGEL